MPKKSFEVDVTHSYTYTVEFDTDLFTEESMAAYSDGISETEPTLAAHAANIAERVLVDDTPDFIEGYGEIRYHYPAMGNRSEYSTSVTEDKGITVKPEVFSEEIETDVREVKAK